MLLSAAISAATTCTVLADKPIIIECIWKRLTVVAFVWAILWIGIFLGKILVEFHRDLFKAFWRILRF